MRIARLLLVVMVLLVTACNPLGPAPTPTLIPFQLSDSGMQQSSIAAVHDYAERLGYEYRSPSFTLIDITESKANIHVTVSFQTRKDFPWEDYDAMLVLDKVAGSWTFEPIQATNKIAWAMTPQRGPVMLKSGAGFSVNVPAGWAAYVAPDSELKLPNVCGVGADPVAAVPLLVVMPIGYSVENVPIILRGFQQCPRISSLSALRQRIESIRDSDKTLNFQRIEVKNMGNVSVLVVEMSDPNGTVAYDYYVIHHERQLEFVLQAHAGLDVTQLLGVLNGIQFN